MLETPILRLTVKVAAATSVNRFVTATGAAPTAGGNALGPTYTKAGADEKVAVTALGVATAVASAAITAGAALEVLADGRVKTVTASKVTVARALAAASAANDELPVLIIPN